MKLFTQQVITPIGRICIVADAYGVVSISLTEDSVEEIRSDDTIACAEWLNDYFGRHNPDISRVRISSNIHLPPFQKSVLEATSTINYGCTATYGDIAKMINNPRASQAVGNALHTNPLMILIPCHRVLPASGRIGGYAGGGSVKEILLKLEKK